VRVLGGDIHRNRLNFGAEILNCGAAAEFAISSYNNVLAKFSTEL
jgi:hypothetical protein